MLHLLLLCDESFRFLGYYIDDISILKSLQTEKTQRFWVGDNWAASVLIGAVVDSGFRVAQATWGFQNPLPKKQNCFQWNNHAESLDSDGELLPTLCRLIASWLGDVSKPWFPWFSSQNSWYVHGHLLPNSTQIRHLRTSTAEPGYTNRRWWPRHCSHNGRQGTMPAAGQQPQLAVRAAGKAGKAGGAGWQNGILDVSWNTHQMHMDIHWYTNQQRSFWGLVCKW